MAKPMVEEKSAAGPVAVEQTSLLDQIVEQGRFNRYGRASAARALSKNSSSRCWRGR